MEFFKEERENKKGMAEKCFSPMEKESFDIVSKLIVNDASSELLLDVLKTRSTYCDGNGFLFVTCNTGYTLLHLAVQSSSHIEVIEDLVKRGSDIHAKTNTGLDPLFLAVSNNNFSATKFLLDQGANPNTKSEKWTAIGKSAYNDYSDIFFLLLSRRADHMTQMIGPWNKTSGSNAIELYGYSYFLSGRRTASNESILDLANRLDSIKLIVKQYENWNRRWPFIQIMFFNDFQHTEKRLKELKESAIPPSELIPPTDISTPEKKHAERVKKVFSDPNIWKLIMRFI